MDGERIILVITAAGTAKERPIGLWWRRVQKREGQRLAGFGFSRTI